MIRRRRVPLPWDRSLAWALEYPALLTADGPGRVAWLLGLVADTAGPDLSTQRPTLASTRDLWSWCAGWVDAGCPGPTVSGAPRWDAGDTAAEQLFAETPGARARALVGEAMVHYLAACLQTVDPSFRWAPYWIRGIVEHDCGTPKMVSDSGGWMPLLAWGTNFAESVAAQPPPWGPDTLIDSVVGELRAYGYRVDDDGVPVRGARFPRPRKKLQPLPLPPTRKERPRPGTVAGQWVVWPSRLHAADLLDPGQLDPRTLSALRQERETVLSSAPVDPASETYEPFQTTMGVFDCRHGIDEGSVRNAWWNLGLQEVLTDDPDRRLWLSADTPPRVRMDVVGGDCQARALVLTVTGVDRGWWKSGNPMQGLVWHNPVVAMPVGADEHDTFGRDNAGHGDRPPPDTHHHDATHEEPAPHSGAWTIWRSRVHPPGVLDAADIDGGTVDALHDELEREQHPDGVPVPRRDTISRRGLAAFARRLGLNKVSEASHDTETLYTDPDETIHMEVLTQARRAYAVQVSTTESLTPTEWDTLMRALHRLTRATKTVALCEH